MIPSGDTKSDTSPTPRDPFPIAAVGASAGGLAPTVEILRELGDRPGIAVVVIHHLDPTHDSALVEILARATAMPVVVASDGARVEPNHVYVVPPNAGLLIGRGSLKVVPRPGGGGLHLPIDRFCESLAMDQGGLAMVVVLSGSGFDGTEGVKAVKREGGITLAQDATAAFGSMPESAIATGCVDFILSPASLARELVRVGAHAASFRAAQPGAIEEPAYPRILAAMRKASGVDFEGYKQSTIRRRLHRRLAVHGLSDLAAYAELLKSDPAEIGTLCGEVLIHVTGFFREPEAFDALRTHVFPKLCESRPRDAPIRVWVPGCSTGEEVYSIAICLLEFLREAGKELPIKIFGTDLDLATITRARAGRYPDSVERDVSPGRIQRFFTRDEGGYQIRRDVRDLCVFAKHDVTRDPPFSAMDLISCRNLMIYLGPELQDRVISLLHYALKEPGFLALGSMETARGFPGFAAVDGKNKIYARTSAGPPLAFDFATSNLGGDGAAAMSAAELLASPARARAAGPSDVYREADRLALAEFAPPGVIVTNDLAIVQFRGETGPFVGPAPGAASLDLLRMARSELRVPLRRAIEQARATQRPVREKGLKLATGEELRTVTLAVVPFAVHSPPQRFFLVLFEDSAPRDAATEAPAAPAAPETQQAVESALRQELASTRQCLEAAIEQLEATNEELRAANEEIVSSNEELRSTNEELQSAKEELQATNEELRTVNEELSDRNVEATSISDDLTNVLTSADIPILLVGRDLRLRRFTPAAGRVFGLLPADLHRPLSDARTLVAVAPALSQRITEVLEQLRPLDFTLQAPGGRFYQLSVRPYLTLDGRIDGAVIAARDIDAETRSAERVAEARKYAEDIVETVREGLVVLDHDLRVRSANTAFQRAFHLALDEITGRQLGELGRPELATPALRKLLVELSEGATEEGFKLEHGDRAGDRRVFVLNARHIEGTEFFLVAIEDVTEVERAEREIHAYQDQLRRIAFDTAVTEERERRRIAVELHDRIGQDLALAQIKLTPVRSGLEGEARAAVNEAVELLEKAIQDSRTLVFELSPPVLYDLGLKAALSWLAEDVEMRHRVKIELTDDGADKPLDDAAKAVVFRVARELIMNVLKHATTPSAKVSLRRIDDQLQIDVEDRGIGFDPGVAANRPGPGGFGLLSAREQISRLGGTLDIESAPQQGTLVSVRIPLHASPTAREANREDIPGGRGTP